MVGIKRLYLGMLMKDYTLWRRSSSLELDIKVCLRKRMLTGNCYASVWSSETSPGAVRGLTPATNTSRQVSMKFTFRRFKLDGFLDLYISCVISLIPSPHIRLALFFFLYLLLPVLLVNGCIKCVH